MSTCCLMRECEVRSDADLRCGTPVSFNVIVRPVGDRRDGEAAAGSLAGLGGGAVELAAGRARGFPELRGEISPGSQRIRRGQLGIKQLKEGMADRPAGVRRLAAAALSAGMNVIVAAPAEEASCRHPFPGPVAAVLPRGHERQRAGDDGNRSRGARHPGGESATAVTLGAACPPPVLTGPPRWSAGPSASRNPPRAVRRRCREQAGLWGRRRPGAPSPTTRNCCPICLWSQRA